MARSRAWGGNPPADDAEARDRIITAATKHAKYHGLRITPKIYTTLDEIDTFGDAIEALLKNGVGTA